MSCGICGSTNTSGGSWSGDWCNECGAHEIIDEWITLEEYKSSSSDSKDEEEEMND